MVPVTVDYSPSSNVTMDQSKYENGGNDDPTCPLKRTPPNKQGGVGRQKHDLTCLLKRTPSNEQGGVDRQQHDPHVHSYKYQ